LRDGPVDLHVGIEDALGHDGVAPMRETRGKCHDREARRDGGALSFTAMIVPTLSRALRITALSRVRIPSKRR
jgi:hypothetical protein